jgi:transcriptional regulator with XRE-family HTH domain
LLLNDGKSSHGLMQDPHAVREPKENVLEMAIGHEVRAFRKKLGITVTDLASATGISLGMLSKIENGNISPSLTTLQALSRALGVPLTAFFRRFEERRNAMFVKAGEGVEIERRGTRAGHQYNLLGHIDNNSSGVVVEPYLITLTTESDIFPTFQHEGMEFLYMLDGEVTYRHGDQLYHMQPGDSLFFDADARHGPEVLVKLPARYLSIISYPQG